MSRYISSIYQCILQDVIAKLSGTINNSIFSVHLLSAFIMIDIHVLENNSFKIDEIVMFSEPAGQDG